MHAVCSRHSLHHRLLSRAYRSLRRRPAYWAGTAIGGAVAMYAVFVLWEWL